MADSRVERKLNLVMSYPIKWELYTVMNNFVQNFYDAIDSAKFMDHFEYKFVDNTIILKSDVGFSKEWLYFMGTSTKRDKERKYAGRFGEGFKIASLVAYRDFGLGIQMESRDWKLVVKEAEDEIDGVKVKVLAYEIEDRPYEETAILTLTNAKEEHFERIRAEVNHFYHEGNTRFGRLIAKGKDYAIYEAVKVLREKRIGGALFVNYQKRDELDLPLIVCNHNFEVSADDRDRSSLDIRDSNCAIRAVFRMVSPEEALELLEICKPRWKNTYGTDWERRNWYGMIEILIDKIAGDIHTKRKFEEKYQNKLVIMGYLNWSKSYKKKMALLWFRQSEYYKTTRVVSNLFAKFEVPSIGALCEKHNGFDEEVAPDEVQRKYIKILETIAKTFFADLICYEQLPECRILLNKEAPILGKARCTKEEKRIENKYGKLVKTRISNIYVQEYILKRDMFAEALSVYLHELLHQFGGDCSRQFKDTLVEMNRIMMTNIHEINAYICDWRAIEDGTD